MSNQVYRKRKPLDVILNESCRPPKANKTYDNLYKSQITDRGQVTNQSKRAKKDVPLNPALDQESVIGSDESSDVDSLQSESDSLVEPVMKIKGTRKLAPPYKKRSLGKRSSHRRRQRSRRSRVNRSPGAHRSSDLPSRLPELTGTSTPELSFGDDVDEEETPHDEVRLLWFGSRRRPDFQPSPGDEAVLQATIKTLRARIFSDAECGGIWPEGNKSKLDRLIRETWIETAERIGQVPGTRDSGTSQVPNKYLARMIYDSIGAFRAHMIDRIRNVVRAHYSFTYENPSRRHVVELLEHDAFAYEVPKERKRLFLAEVIVKALVAVFFSTTKGGLGLRVATQHMFKVIRPGSLIPVVVGIRHALTEFLAGERRVIKFESSFAEEAQEQIKATWDIQTEKRKKKILELLTSKVRRQRGLDDQASSPTVRPLPNPYRNNLDDLEDLLVPSTPLVTETPYGSQPSNVHGIEALADYNGDEAVEGHGGNKVFRGNNDQASEGYNGDKSRTTSEAEEHERSSQRSHTQEQAEPGEPSSSRQAAETIKGLQTGFTVKVKGKRREYPFGANTAWRHFLSGVDAQYGRIWYKPGPRSGSVIVDDRDGFQKFVEHAKSQGKVEIELGGPDSEDFKEPGDA